VLTTPVRNGLDRFLEMCQYPCLATARHKGQHLGRPRVFVSRSRIESLRQEGQSWREMAQELNTNTATARSSRVEENAPELQACLGPIRRFQLRARLGRPWLTGSPLSRIPPCRFPAVGSTDVTPSSRPGVGDWRAQLPVLAQDFGEPFPGQRPPSGAATQPRVPDAVDSPVELP